MTAGDTVDEDDSPEEQARKEEEEEKRAERRAQEERDKKVEYMGFRRELDGIKRQHEGDHAESDKLKAQGNQFFSLGLYMQASKMYSEAIELQPENAVLYCNRAMAYLKQDMAADALADAEKSLEIDSTETNIKAYWRKAQALLDLRRYEESEEAADTGISMQASNKHLNQVRRKAREFSTLLRLVGDAWTVKLENGVDKRYSFSWDGTLTMEVFGHKILATFDLSVEGNPRSMFVRMKCESAGSGPPPPPMAYIFEFHDNDQELWLCHPVESTELPTSFEGPGFDRMRRAPKAPEAAAELDDEPLDVRCGRYICEMNRVLPVIPPQLPAKPSDEEVQEELLIMEQIAQLKARFGLPVHQRSVELAKDPSQAGSAEVAALARELQRRFVARKIMPEPPVAPVAAAATPDDDGAVASEAAAEGPHQLPSATRAPRLHAPGSKAAGPPGGCLGGLVARLCSRGRS
mmetsp:Transcript_694/g.2010  ORF Transcript_694/g.2010 Transcript_694/m.2010 type:complete len:463 (-) Transcript_694:64-1452(-)